MKGVSFWKRKSSKREKGKEVVSGENEVSHPQDELPNFNHQFTRRPESNPQMWSTPELLGLHRKGSSSSSVDAISGSSGENIASSMETLCPDCKNGTQVCRVEGCDAHDPNSIPIEISSENKPASAAATHYTLNKRGWSAPPCVGPTFVNGFSPVPGSGEFPRFPGLLSGESLQRSLSGNLPENDDIDEDAVTRLVTLANEGNDTDKESAAQGFWEVSRAGPLSRGVVKSVGGIRPLVSLLSSPNQRTVEFAVRALANLSINDDLKIAIPAAGAIPVLVTVLKTGSSEARANAAATLYSLSKLDVNKIVVGEAGAITPLVDLLTLGNPQGRKDAATALFNLSIYKENKTKILEAGGVQPLLAAIQHEVAAECGDSALADKMVAVLANLVTSSDGRTEIVRHKGVICLCEILHVGSPSGKEFAAAALLLLWQNCHSDVHKIIQEQNVVDHLSVIQTEGTSRAKLKAAALLKMIRQSVL